MISLTYLQTRWTEDGEVEVDHTSLPAQHATKTNGLAYIHRSGQMLSLQISYSLSPFSSLSKKKKKKELLIPLHSCLAHAHYHWAILVSASNTSNLLRQKQTIIIVLQLLYYFSQLELCKCGAVTLFVIWESSHQTQFQLNMHHTVKGILSNTSFKWKVKAGVFAFFFFRLCRNLTPHSLSLFLFPSTSL